MHIWAFSVTVRVWMNAASSAMFPLIRSIELLERNRRPAVWASSWFHAWWASMHHHRPIRSRGPEPDGWMHAYEYIRCSTVGTGADQVPGTYVLVRDMIQSAEHICTRPGRSRESWQCSGVNILTDFVWKRCAALARPFHCPKPPL